MTVRKNVASQKLVFTLINASTGAVLTGATVTAKVSIDGGASTTAAGAVAELANGQYCWSPAQADTNGDALGVQFTATNAIPVAFTIYTTAANPSDGAALGLTLMPSNVTQWLGTAPLVLSSQQVQSVVPVTQKVDVETVKTRAVTAAGAVVVGGFVGQDTAAIGVNGSGHVSRVVLTDTVTTLTNAPSDSSGVTTLLSRLSALRAGYLDNLSAGAVALEASLQALITTIGASAAGVATAVWGAATRLLTAGTNIVLAKGVGVTGFNDLSAAQVNAEADTALADIGATSTRMGYLDNLSAGAVALASSLSSVASNVTSVLGKFTGITLLAQWLGAMAGKQTPNATALTEINATGAGSGTFTGATDSVEAIRDRGDAAWTTATGFSTHSAADVWAVGTRTLTSFGTLVADVTTAVWAAGTRTLTAFDSSFKTGYALSSAGVQAVWDALTSALTTVGSIGKLLVDNINAAISSRASQTSVDDLPTNAELATALGTADDAVLAAIAALNNLSQANIRTAVGLASANLDTQLDALPTNTELATALGTADDAILAAIAALNNLSQANIRTAVGLASANLDTQLDALPTNSELATALAAADDAVLAAIAALNNLSSAQVTAAVPTSTQNADALLKRDFSAVTGEATRSALNALRFLRNKWAISSGTLSVKKEDDVTDAWTGAVTQTSGNPVSEIDPA